MEDPVKMEVTDLVAKVGGETGETCDDDSLNAKSVTTARLEAITKQQ